MENPSQAIFNLFIQGSKHYDQFTSNIDELMQLKHDFMSRVVGGRVNNILDLNRVYVKNIGNIFVESMEVNESQSKSVNIIRMRILRLNIPQYVVKKRSLLIKNSPLF